MKYIRTKDGRIIETSELVNCEDKRFPNGWFTKNGEPLIAIKQADTIKELIQDGDLCHLAECKVCRDRISVVKVFPREDYIGISIPGIEYTEEDVLELWIKDTKGNYIKVAQKETKEGELELL